MLRQRVGSSVSCLAPWLYPVIRRPQWDKADHAGSEAASKDDNKQGIAPFQSFKYSNVFLSADELLEYVTKYWSSDYVTTYLPDEKVLDLFSRRPFFLLVSVDAPVTTRWERYQNKRTTLLPYLSGVGATKSNGTGVNASHPGGIGGEIDEEFKLLADDNDENWTAKTLEQFVSLSDRHLYDSASGKSALMSRATVRLVNSSNGLAELRTTLAQIDLLNQDRLRPPGTRTSWRSPRWLRTARTA